MEETLDPNFSPNKRPKLDYETLNPPISPSSDKGKAPIADDEDDDYDSPADLPPQNCGICFSDEGKSVRGLIDCCNHYFCFLCIIEWSKIESRCPLCRGRFSTIRRMRKDGSFIGDGSVRIPVRNQIYDPFGEPTDPYGQAKCTVCNGTNDESLLLLCDLCDSPWHTYCIGLGASVPEGDWYCRDCALLRAEQHGSEMNDNVNNSDDNVDNSSTSEHVDEESTATGSVSIFDIVRDSEEPTKPDRAVARLWELVSPTRKFSCPTITPGRVNNPHAESSESSGGTLKPQIDGTLSSVRTLHNCRNVREHINMLRDNWDAFRTGGLSFSSRRKDGERSCESLSSSTPSSFQKKLQGTSSDPLHRKNPYDVDKAWKLMNIAKSMQHDGKSKGASQVASFKALAGKTSKSAAKRMPCGRKDIMSCALRMQSPQEKVSGTLPRMSGKQKYPSVVPKAAANTTEKLQNFHISRSLLSRVQTSPQDVIHYDTAGRGVPTFFDSSFTSSMSLYRPKQQTSVVSCTKLHKKGISNCPQGQVRGADKCSTSETDVGCTDNIHSTSSHSQITGASDLFSANLCGRQMPAHLDEARDADNCNTRYWGAQTSAQPDTCNDRAGFPHVQNLSELSKAFDDCNGAACSISSPGPSKGVYNVSLGKLHRREVSSCLQKAKPKISDKITSDDEAKTEIQSLVKLNLKLLSKDKQMGTDAFKDIARISTHTILAACGFEHRKIVRSCPTLVCSHNEQVQQHNRSMLMPSSCRECFYLFVKNVVNSIMSEKLDSCAVTC